MTSSRIHTGLPALVLLTLTLTSSALAQEAPLPPDARDAERVSGTTDSYVGNYYYDADGRRMRVVFDRGNRLVLGTTYDGRFDLAGRGAGRHDAGFMVGLDLRADGKGQNEDCWKAWHRIGFTQIEPWTQAKNGWPALRTVLFEGDYVRYLASPYLSLPSRPHKKTFVPFNFGLTVKTAGLDIPIATGTSGWDVQIIDARLLLDFWRTPRAGSALLLGIGLRYNIWLTDVAGDVETEHILSPFTAASLLFRHESADGHHGFQVGVDAYPFWSDRRGWAMGLDAQTRYEVMILAVNDQPLSLYASAAYHYSGITMSEGATASEFRLMAGLSFSYQL